MNFRKTLSGASIHNSYIIEKIGGTPENTTKRKILHLLETAPTHATDYDKKKGLYRKN